MSETQYALLAGVGAAGVLIVVYITGSAAARHWNALRVYLGLGPARGHEGPGDTKREKRVVEVEHAHEVTDVWYHGGAP